MRGLGALKNLDDTHNNFHLPFGKIKIHIDKGTRVSSLSIISTTTHSASANTFFCSLCGC